MLAIMISSCFNFWHFLILLLHISCSFLFIQSSYKDDVTNDYLRQTDHPYHKNPPSSNSKSLFDEFAHTMSTDESKLRLALLVDDKIDQNKDGLVQLDELVGWLRESQDRYAQEDVNRHWIAYEKQLDDTSSISWKEYADREYEHLVALTKQSGSQEQVDLIKKSHEYHIQRDLRRWKAADLNQDGCLSRNEFKMFLYPEHSESMHGLVVEEKFELLDRNNDGKVSADEYLADLPPEETHYSSQKRDDWLRNEKSKFLTQIDSNHDSYLDKSELARAVSRSEMHDQVITEAQHLMHSADSNKDHRLSKEEILLAYHEFVNSHATDFGEALRSHKLPSHDEL